MKAKGFTFDYAFPRALGRVTWPHDKRYRDEWKLALAETRSAWERCYEDIGTPIDLDGIVSALSLAEDGYEAELAA